MERSLGTDDAVSEAIEKYADMVRRICFLYLRNYADVEDVFQDVFLKYFLNEQSLESEDHRKAWLCRVTFNKCKDMCRSFWRSRVVSIEEMDIPVEDPVQGEFIKEILKLPAGYREVIYLHYYEGRTVPEIAEIMEKNINTVYTWLRRARDELKMKVGDNYL